jgi:D-alanyl-D-alanine carboxypeptidase/D-alanyl-D-alanine-endopeptidase (penicillin-binding protein 4)
MISLNAYAYEAINSIAQEENYHKITFVLVDLRSGIVNNYISKYQKIKQKSGSVLKLITICALIEQDLEPWVNTPLLAESTQRNGLVRGSIFFRGSGNALLTDTDLEQVTQRMVNGGITRITGDIVGDDTLFETDSPLRTRVGSAYAPPCALGLDLHTVSLTLSPSLPGDFPGVALAPPNSMVRVAVSARTVSGIRNDIRITRLDDMHYKVEGNLPVGSAPVSARFPLDDPALYAAGTLKTLLEEAGIKVEGMVRKGKTPDDAVVLADIPGPPMKAVLRDMNHHSLNVVADNLLLALGAERFGPLGTREKGVRAVEEFLVGLDLPMDEVEIYDGSGLNDKNRVTANFMAQFLHKISKKPWFEEFKTTLPRAGYDGTVKNLPFRDERFRVKSGRLEDVYALAGYGVDGAGKDVAFCFIVNGPGVGMLPNMDQIGADVLRAIATETVH